MILALAAGSFGLFACSGDGDDDSDNGNEPTAAGTSEAGGEPTTSGGGDANSELSDLATGLAESPGKVAYTFTSSAGTTESTGSFTLFWNPPGFWRIDMETDGTTVTFITVDGSTYSCAEGACFESPVGIPLPFLSFLTNPESLVDLVDTEAAGIEFEKSDDEIAGQSVTCYSASGTVEGQEGSAQYCFNDDGLMLRLDGGSEVGGAFRLEATNVESTVSEADFELPYPAQSIPGQ